MLHVGRTEDMMEGNFPSDRKQGKRGSRKHTGSGRKSLQELEFLGKSILDP